VGEDPSTIQVSYATISATYFCSFLTASTSGSLQISATRESCWESGGAVGSRLLQGRLAGEFASDDFSKGDVAKGGTRSGFNKRSMPQP